MMTKLTKLLEVLVIIFNLIRKQVNETKRERALADPVRFIAGHGQLRQSSATFTELATLTECDSACGRRSLHGCRECQEARNAKG
ncbi:hypothetical protein [Paraferrimonas haliotis]|uniref:hypothetical protein n=1 Tax=Paraferrimonas haliotis TaxID=2013866 RepID=UPI0015C751F9|nr:hypothetical protein [Paraferrimonas haliotis]